MDLEQKIILIVDDEETLTWSMSKNLSLSKEYKILSANSGEEALEVLEKIGEVDLVVSDIKMEKKDGLQLLSEVRAKFPKTGFIIMTAYGSSEKRQEILDKGVIRYLEKPFMMDQVKGLINEVLTERDQLSEPLDEKFKQEVKNNTQIQELLLNKSHLAPGLLSIQLLAMDGECLLQAGSSLQKDGLKSKSVVKTLNKIQQLSQDINAGTLQEIILNSEKYNIIFYALPESPLILYIACEKNLLLGKVMLIVNQLTAQIINILGR